MENVSIEWPAIIYNLLHLGVAYVLSLPVTWNREHGGAVAFARFEVAILIGLVTFLTLRVMSPIKKERNSDDAGDETGSSS